LICSGVNPSRISSSRRARAGRGLLRARLRQKRMNAWSFSSSSASWISRSIWPITRSE
jgi:hypothetical protein